MTRPKLRLGVFAQLALLMGGLAVTSAAVALVIQDRTLNTDLLAAASARLDGAAAAADRLMSDHLGRVAERYTAISETPEFRANLEAGDRATLTYFAERLVARQGATGVAFRGPDGDVVAVAGEEDVTRGAAERVRTRPPAYLRGPSGLMAVATVPLFTDDELVGHLVAVERVDPELLADWSQVLGVRVSVGDIDLPASSALQAVPEAYPEAGLRLSTTYEPERRAISRARRNLILAGLASALIALIASLLLAHSFANPIREMKLAVEGVDLASLDTSFEVRRDDELGDLGRAFGDMLKRLNESEVRLVRAQRLARFSNWSLDLDTNVVEGSSDFRRLFGLTEQEVIHLDDLVENVHPEDRSKLVDGVDRVRAPNGAFRTDVRVASDEGRDRILHIRGQHLSSPGGETRVEASIQDVTERWHSARQIEYLSLHDSVTGLGNRQYLLERLGVQLKQAEHDELTVAVLLIGLEGFAGVEGTMGHRVGDELLCEVARRLIATLGVPRRHDRRRRREPSAYTVVRFGHAEFGAVDVVVSQDEAAALAESVVRAIEEVYVIEGHEILLSATVGVSLFPDDARTVEEIMRGSKAALQTARSASDSFCFYEESMHEHQSRRLRIASLLRRALDDDELELHYQPRVRPDSGNLIAVEALARWTNDDLGVVSPAEFVPIAEEVGLVQDLGDWCLRTAVADLHRWRSMGVTDLRVSVNVSPQQLRPAFVDRVLEVTADVEPASLEFEVTETALMRNPTEAMELLTRLADHGFRIALDDFGTGYSSMSHVRQLPLHSVKIDQSFIKELATHNEARSITWAVIMMCEAMQLEAVAEGVETEPQRRRLVELGCAEAQGFLFGRPMPAPKLEQLMREQTLLTEPETAA